MNVYKFSKFKALFETLCLWGITGIALLVLNSAQYAGEWPASCVDQFVSGERAAGAYCMQGREDPRTGMRFMQTRKISFPY
jgi:hypothetical protein